MAELVLTVDDAMSCEDDPFYSPENMARLRKSIAQLDAGGGTEHELIDTDYLAHTSARRTVASTMN